MEASRIQVLPDVLIDQIAAGEVVESPASVVKELLENALDAGARRIVVEVADGGLSHLRVLDDGEGMSPADAVLALRRHATSKIRDPEDLDRIATMGFRGEALPSIASVSRFTLVTRRPSDEAGTRVTARDGQVTSEPFAAPSGTSVTVDDLFHNVPARRKFQKAERTLTAGIAETVARAALAFPSLHLVLAVAGRRPIEYPPCARLADRVAQVFGRDVANRLHPVQEDRDNIAVTGVIGDPALARNDASRLVLLVNRRPVQDLALRRAVLNAYSVLVPAGRFPVAVLAIELAPVEVDVNVHPRKIEVRFARPRDVASALFSAVQSAVVQTPWIAQAGLDPFATEAEPKPFAPDPATLGHLATPGVRESMALPHPTLPTRQPGLFGEASSPAALRLADLRYIGQAGRTVLVCEGRDTLVLVDQHAAHERVNFDRLWQGVREGTVASEPLMFPEVVTLDPAEAAGLDAARDILGRLGFDLEPYSGDSIAVRAIPAVMRGRGAAALVRECAQAAAGESGASGTERLHRIVATIACHASIRAGDALSESDALALLASMDTVADLAAYCPHGRQAVIVHPMSTVLRWFGR